MTLSDYFIFCSQSERQLTLHCTENLSQGPITTISLDVSPSTLIPHYDPDIGLLILTGKVSILGSHVWVEVQQKVLSGT